jgi:hypothetical protein
MNSVAKGVRGGAEPRPEGVAIMGSRHKAANDEQKEVGLEF